MGCVDYVRSLAARACRGRPRLRGHYEDMASEAMLALVQKEGEYDANTGVSLLSFAGQRMQGAMIDYLRTQHPRSRQLHDLAGKHRLETEELTQKHRRKPTDDEIADAMGMDSSEYGNLVLDLNATKLQSLDVPSKKRRARSRAHYIEDYRGQKSPANTIDTHDFWVVMLQGLSTKERVVVLLLYRQRMSFAEVAEHIGIERKNLYHLHSVIIGRLRSRLLSHAGCDDYLGEIVDREAKKRAS